MGAAGYAPGAPGLQRSERLHRGLETLFCVVIFIWFVAGTFALDQIFRTQAGTLPAFAAFFGSAALLLIRTGFGVRMDTIHLALYAFLAAGLVALALSYLDYPEISYLQRSDRFIVRQSYFLVLLPVALMAGSVFWSRSYRALFPIAARYFLPLMVTVIAADWITAYLWGDVQSREFNGYSQYADKGTLTFLVSFIYLARVASRPTVQIVPLVLIVLYFTGTQVLTYGAVFQATTGTLVFIVLVAATLLRPQPLMSAYCLMAILTAVTAILVVGTCSPELFQSDANAYWRFSNWQSNFQSLLQSGFLGVGFGTPYFEITSEDLNFALTILERGQDPWIVGAGTYDLIYLRTQHNSFVNMFFRTGLIGGAAFLIFNLGVTLSLLRALRSASREVVGHFGMAFALITIGMVQIALHVGLETPRFLVVYAFSISLALAFIALGNDTRGTSTLTKEGA